MTLKLDVRGRSFKIDLVSNWVRRRYAEMVEASTRMQELSGEIAGIIEELGKVTEPDQFASIQERADKARAEINERKNEVLEARQEVIEELLESNGLKYDGDWWDKKTGPEDVNDFLLACLNKDFVPGKDSSVKKN